MRSSILLKFLSAVVSADLFELTPMPYCSDRVKLALKRYIHASMPRAAFVMRDLFRAVAYMHNSKDPWQDTVTTTSHNYLLLDMSLQVSMQSCLF